MPANQPLISDLGFSGASETNSTAYKRQKLTASDDSSATAAEGLHQEIKLCYVVVTELNDDGSDGESFVLCRKGGHTVMDWELRLRVEIPSQGPATLVLHMILVRRFPEDKTCKTETIHHFALSIPADAAAIKGIDETDLIPFQFVNVKETGLLHPSVKDKPSLLKFRDQGVLLAGDLFIRRGDMRRWGFSSDTDKVPFFFGRHENAVRGLLSIFEGPSQRTLNLTFYCRKLAAEDSVTNFEDDLEGLREAGGSQNFWTGYASAVNQTFALQVQKAAEVQPLKTTGRVLISRPDDDYGIVICHMPCTNDPELAESFDLGASIGIGLDMEAGESPLDCISGEIQPPFIVLPRLAKELYNLQILIPIHQGMRAWPKFIQDLWKIDNKVLERLVLDESTAISINLYPRRIAAFLNTTMKTMHKLGLGRVDDTDRALGLYRSIEHSAALARVRKNVELAKNAIVEEDAMEL